MLADQHEGLATILNLVHRGLQDAVVVVIDQGVKISEQGSVIKSFARPLGTANDFFLPIRQFTERFGVLDSGGGPPTATELRVASRHLGVVSRSLGVAVRTEPWAGPGGKQNAFRIDVLQAWKGVYELRLRGRLSTDKFAKLAGTSL